MGNKYVLERVGGDGAGTGSRDVPSGHHHQHRSRRLECHGNRVRQRRSHGSDILLQPVRRLCGNESRPCGSRSRPRPGDRWYRYIHRTNRTSIIRHRRRHHSIQRDRGQFWRHRHADGLPSLSQRTGYVSFTSLSDTGVFDNATLSSLGMTTGTYTYTWGTGGLDHTLTVQIGLAGSKVTRPSPSPQPPS